MPVETLIVTSGPVGPLICGSDVGAKYEIYPIINELSAQGNGVVMISSEMPELLGMCDRIYVMSEGSFVAELPAVEASQERIMSLIVSE